MEVKAKMKKIILILLLLVLFAPSVLARSGACSGHGGVDCAAGQDYDGSVICEDGWRNSSVSYSSMVKCSSYATPVIKTVAPVAPIVTTQPTKVYEPVPELEPIVVVPIKTTPKIEVKEMDLEESYDYLNIPTSSEKPKTISKIEVPLEPAKASSNEGSSAAGVVVGLGGLAGAGYLIKKFRKR